MSVEWVGKEERRGIGAWRGEGQRAPHVTPHRAAIGTGIGQELYVIC